MLSLRLLEVSFQLNLFTEVLAKLFQLQGEYVKVHSYLLVQGLWNP